MLGRKWWVGEEGGEGKTMNEDGFIILCTTYTWGLLILKDWLPVYPVTSLPSN